MTPRRPVEGRRRRAKAADGERINDWLIAIFFLGVVLLSPLVIDIFDRGPQVRVFGLPLLYFYLFASWTLLIALLAWVLERPAAANEDGSDERPHDYEGPGGAPL